jgi:hypothetical protein
VGFAASERRAVKAASLFDVRRIIGGLFIVYGVVLAALGPFDSQQEIDKAAAVKHQPVDRHRDAGLRPADDHLVGHAPARRPADLTRARPGDRARP